MINLLDYISDEMKKDGKHLKKENVDFFGKGFWDSYKINDQITLDVSTHGYSLKRNFRISNKDNKASFSIDSNFCIKVGFNGNSYPLHPLILKELYRQLPFVEGYIKKIQSKIKYDDLSPKKLSILILKIKYERTN